MNTFSLSPTSSPYCPHHAQDYWWGWGVGGSAIAALWLGLNGNLEIVGMSLGTDILLHNINKFC